MVCSGSEFQVWAAATGKARLSMVSSLTGGTTRRLVPAERRTTVSKHWRSLWVLVINGDGECGQTYTRWTTVVSDPWVSPSYRGLRSRAVCPWCSPVPAGTPAHAPPASCDAPFLYVPLLTELTPSCSPADQVPSSPTYICSCTYV